MAKQIGVSINDEMYAKYQKLKEEFGLNDTGRKTMSEICREAIAIALEEAEAHHVYRKAGIKDGRKKENLFSEADKKYINRILSKSGPYKKWTRFAKIEELKNHFEYIQSREIDTLYPKFNSMMDGIEAPKHAWVDDKDKMAEVCWSYCAGCFEGIRDAYNENIDVE